MTRPGDRRLPFRTMGRTGAFVLAGIVIVAAGLRLWRITWGLADRNWFPDETLFWGVHMNRLWPRKWQYLLYPTFYRYAANLGAHAASALGLIDPLTIPEGVPGFLLIARLVSVVSGVATVVVVAGLGRRMYGAPVGLAAAAFVAVIPSSVMQGYYASVDSLLVLGVAATLLSSYALAQRGTRALAFVAGATAGLAFTAKYPGGIAVTAVAWAIGERAWRERSWRRFVALTLAAVAGCAVAVALVCPACVVRYDLMFRALIWLRNRHGDEYAAFAGGYLVESLGWYGRPYLYQLVAALPHALGWPLWLLAAFGVGVALRRRELADRVLLAQIVPYFAMVGSASVTVARYLLPLAPALAIFAARGVRGRGTHPRASAGVVAVVWLYTLVLSASQVGRFSNATQDAVAGWLATHAVSAPRGAPVRVLSVPPFMSYLRLSAPLARAGVAYEGAAPGRWFKGAPPFIVLPVDVVVTIRRDRPDSPEAGDLDRLEAGEVGYRLAARFESLWYVQRAVDEWIDPGLVGHPGDVGFRVYKRVAPTATVSDPEVEPGAAAAVLQRSHPGVDSE
jgi:hypothetical protein